MTSQNVNKSEQSESDHLAEASSQDDDGSNAGAQIEKPKKKAGVRLWGVRADLSRQVELTRNALKWRLSELEPDGIFQAFS